MPVIEFRCDDCGKYWTDYVILRHGFQYKALKTFFGDESFHQEIGYFIKAIAELTRSLRILHVTIF